MTLAMAAASPVAVPGVFKSPIEGVIDVAWSRLVRALAMRDDLRTGTVLPRPPGEVSPSGHLGMFALSPRRLEEIGWMISVCSVRLASGRMGHAGRFVPPRTQPAFLRNPDLQYQALRDSLVDYADRIIGGKVRLPDGVGLSGGIALLHRGGAGALCGRRFPETEALYRRAANIF